MITADMLISCPWREVVDEADDSACSSFYSGFSAKISGMDENSPDTLAFRLLSSICSMYLQRNSKGDGPFGPFLVWKDGRRSFLPKDLVEAQAEELFKFLQQIDVPDLKARIADTLWVAKKNRDKYLCAKAAVVSYIQAGINLLDGEHPIRGVERLERAVALSAELGRGGLEEMEDAIDACCNALSQLVDKEINATQLRLIRIIFNYAGDENLSLSGVCCDLAEQLEKKEENWNLVRSFWEQVIKNYEKYEISTRTIKKRLAWTYLKEARQAGSYMLKAHVLTNAVEAFRRINESKEKIDLLHKWLLRVQGSVYKEMRTVSSGPLDLTEAVTNAQERVSKKRTCDALVAFSLIADPSDPAKLKEQVVKDSGDFILASLFGSSHLNSDGKVVAKTPPLGLTQEEANEDAVLTKMHFNFDLNCRLQVVGAIEPARRQLLREHSLTVEDLWPVVINCPFIPEGREAIFARGLAAGFEGDFLVAEHLLVPQIENSLRYVVKQRGGLSSTLNSQGIQPERMLNDLLDDPLIEATLGGRIVFCLKALLTEKTGSNFRHSLCHGILDHDSFYTHTAVFIWWLVFRICYTPWLMEWMRRKEQGRKLLNVLQQVREMKK